MALQSYVPSAPVVVDFSLAGSVALQLRSRILDEQEVVLQDWQVETIVPAATSLTITVSAGLNTLTAPSTRGLRSVELEVTTAQGTQVQSIEYLLQAGSSLTLFSSTFLTYHQAVLVAASYPNMTGWDALSRSEREQGMARAFQRLLRVPVRLTLDTSVRSQSKLYGEFSNDYRNGVMLFNFTSAELAELDPRLLEALGRAQVLEAAEVMKVDTTAEMRDAGVISMTVGESSQFFSSTKPMKSLDKISVSSSASEALGPWLGRIQVKLARG